MKNKKTHDLFLTYVPFNIPKEYLFFSSSNFKWSLPYNYILNLKEKQIFKNKGIWWLNEGSF